MSKKGDAKQNERNPVLTFRVSPALKAKIQARAQSLDLNEGEVVRSLLEKGLDSEAQPFTLGWAEGRRAGWNAANEAFREALANTTVKLEKMKP
jgi:antitoxin component of RelBE/YafQ-DinJ toxin-antitoxin module